MIERQQFRVLYRAFLSRLIDFELLSARGQLQTLLVHFAALLAALSFVIVIVLVPRYGKSGFSRERLAVLAWGDQHFLIATTMAIVGLFAVLAWNNLFPDRNDALMLGTLPVRTRTVLLAKLAAISAVLGTSAAAVNSFTGLAFPGVIYPPGGNILRSFFAYWVTMAAAALFVFSSSLALEGVAAQLLSYRLFLRVSSFLQLSAFFAILAAYFLMPPVASHPDWLPSFWFVGLLQKLNGATNPPFPLDASRAV